MNPAASDEQKNVASWHVLILALAGGFTVLLIAMGGVLCATSSIRGCPDWPGCFGKVLPPWEMSPILEVSHRFLAATSGLLILAAAIIGLIRTRRLPWIVIPPLAACLLLVEVSYFGAEVVLKGIAPVWAAVDVGSALLVVALIITTALIAGEQSRRPASPVGLHFRSGSSRLALAAILAVYAVLTSGVLVAGSGSITGCLGWPVFSPAIFRLDAHPLGDGLRLAVSIIGLGLLVFMLIRIWKEHLQKPLTFRAGRWATGFVFLEAGLQVALLTVGIKTGLMVAYTVTAAFLWGSLIVTAVQSGLENYMDTRRSHTLGTVLT